MMPDTSSTHQGMSPDQNRQDELKQHLELRNALSLNIFIAQDYASYLKCDRTYGMVLKPRHIREFFRHFWLVYHYVRDSVEPGTFDEKLIQGCDLWFEMMIGKQRDTELVMHGVDYFEMFRKEMQKLGIGRLVEKGIAPPFMSGSKGNTALLFEEADRRIENELALESQPDND